MRRFADREWSPLGADSPPSRGIDRKWHERADRIYERAAKLWGVIRELADQSKAHLFELATNVVRSLYPRDLCQGETDHSRQREVVRIKFISHFISSIGLVALPMLDRVRRLFKSAGRE
jgi:hypothetical protein